MIRYSYLIFFVISLTIIGSSEQVFADHMTASVSTPQGTSVPGCETTNECFIPYKVTVDVGGVVTWSNDDLAAHTVTSGSAADGASGVFDSSLFMAGTTFSHKFESSGTILYHCMVHPWMEGIVTVIDGSTNTDPPITVKTNSNHYNEGDIIYVSGEVSEILFGYAISLTVIDPDDNLVSIDSVSVGSDKKYHSELDAGGSLMRDDGIYTIQVLYGTKNRTAQTTFTFTGSTSTDATPPKILQPKNIVVDSEDKLGVKVSYDVLVIDDVDELVKPVCFPDSGSYFIIGENKVECTATDISGNKAKPVSFIITVNQGELVIPEWVKNIAEFWCQDKIDDASFVEGIQYLIDNNIIIVSTTSLNSGQSQEIPEWVKNNACWWADGLITDQDFASGIEYLIAEGILKV